MKKILFILTCFISPIALGAHTLTWHDLIPKIEQTAEPMPELSEQELALFRDILSYKLVSEQRALTQDEQAGYNNKLESAKAINLDVESLLKIQEQHLANYKKASTSTVSDLPKDEVALAGFLVPIEMDGLKGTKFLLVPTAGACVHTPPPPINQTVVVEFEQGFVLDSLYTPVSVSGTLVAKSSLLDVNFSDGNQDINIGYQMSASNISSY